MTNKIITMKNFGYNGRVGNQLFQYAFLHFFSHQTGTPVAIPKWIGDYLFQPPPALKDSNLHLSLPHCIQNLYDHLGKDYIAIEEREMTI